MDRATAAFRSIHTEATERLAEASNGLGSVDALRGRYRDALAWIDTALALLPDYPAALHDREQVAARVPAEPVDQSDRPRRGR